MACPPDAETITIRRTLALLDEEFRDFAEGVSENRYALWLGSGISLGRFGDLSEVVSRAIEFLRLNISCSNPKCRFKKALTAALKSGRLNDAEISSIDFAQPFEDWPNVEVITKRLTDQASYVLDTQVDDEKEDYLLWCGAKVVDKFADTSIGPDVEHLCIAILALEGVASDIVSANWDGLVEKAVDTLTNGEPAIRVVVRSEEVREPDLIANLYKFHGCAVKAQANETEFRRYIVARASQINGWITQSENYAMVDQLTALIERKATLMMGLSARDSNIKALFAKAKARLAWSWPGDRPSYVFSEEEIGIDQQSLLKIVYRADYTTNKRQQIINGSLIQAFAKPLLVALVLYVLCAKLRRMIALATKHFCPNDRAALEEGVVAIRNQLADGASQNTLAFVRTLIDQSSRAAMIFRSGHAPDDGRPYNPITRYPVQQMNGDTNLPASGWLEAAVAISIIGIGINSGAWQVATMRPNQETGIVCIRTEAVSRRMYFVANDNADYELKQQEYWEDREDIIVIYSCSRRQLQGRSSRRMIGRSGRPGMVEVSVAELLQDADTSEDLFQLFRYKTAL